jgi:hypothetical protein
MVLTKKLVSFPFLSPLTPHLTFPSSLLSPYMPLLRHRPGLSTSQSYVDFFQNRHFDQEAKLRLKLGPPARVFVWRGAKKLLRMFRHVKNTIT